jgi:hypothetical protein
MQKMMRFSNAVWNYAKSGFVNVSTSTQEKRLSICNKCDQINLIDNTCNSCGCFLNIKTLWASEKCPLDKWGVEEVTTTNQNAILNPLYNPEDINISSSGDCGCGPKNV